jgi:hypothetical protein
VAGIGVQSLGKKRITGCERKKLAARRRREVGIGCINESLEVIEFHPVRLCTLSLS